MELALEEMHQRSAIIMGLTNMVLKAEELLQKY
jgi:fructose-1,6-bisphosphatase